MSEKFYVTVILLLVAFGGFMTWLHRHEIQLIDHGLARCLAPVARIV